MCRRALTRPGSIPPTSGCAARRSCCRAPPPRGPRQPRTPCAPSLVGSSSPSISLRGPRVVTIRPILNVLRCPREVGMAVFRATPLLRLCVLCALLLSGCSMLPAALGEPKFQGDALVGADTWAFTNLTLRPSLQQALRTRDIMDLFAGPLDEAGADLQRLPTPSGRVVDFEKDVLPY